MVIGVTIAECLGSETRALLTVHSKQSSSPCCFSVRTAMHQDATLSVSAAKPSTSEPAKARNAARSRPFTPTRTGKPRSRASAMAGTSPLPSALRLPNLLTISISEVSSRFPYGKSDPELWCLAQLSPVLVRFCQCLGRPCVQTFLRSLIRFRCGSYHFDIVQRSQLILQRSEPL